MKPRRVPRMKPRRVFFTTRREPRMARVISVGGNLGCFAVELQKMTCKKWPAPEACFWGQNILNFRMIILVSELPS